MLRRAFGLLALAVLGACRAQDPKLALEVREIDTYWIVDSPKGGTQYISPTVRFQLRNKTAEPIHAIQATANFKRVGEQENWGSAWEQVTHSDKPLLPGKDVLVVLRSDGRYTSPTEDPESMLKHELFKDARVEVFLRIGPSNWVRMVEADVERRIGARGARELGAP
jgi:hypothetical protein